MNTWNNNNNVPNTIRGRVIVENGFGCLYDGGKEVSYDGSKSKSAREMGEEYCRKTNARLAHIINKTGTVENTVTKSNFPGINKSKVGKSEPKKWDPMYLTIRFDDGSYGFHIHEKYVKKSTGGGKTRRRKLRRNNRNTRRSNN